MDKLKWVLQAKTILIALSRLAEEWMNKFRVSVQSLSNRLLSALQRLSEHQLHSEHCASNQNGYHIEVVPFLGWWHRWICPVELWNPQDLLFPLQVLMFIWKCPSSKLNTINHQQGPELKLGEDICLMKGYPSLMAQLTAVSAERRGSGIVPLHL